MNDSTSTIVAALADCIPARAFCLESAGSHDRLWVPKPAAADYGFYVDTYRDACGASIGALPNETPATKVFWHLPLDYRKQDEQEALRVLTRELRRLLLHPSRITQSAGLFSWHFGCETKEGDEWKRVGGLIACPRLFFAPPFAFTVKRFEYHSNPPRLAV